MRSPRSEAYRSARGVVLSLSAHVAALALLLAGASRAGVKMTQPTTLCCIAAVEVAGGSRARRLPLPEAPAANKPAKTAHVRELARRTANPTREARQAKASGTNAPTAQPMDRGTNSVAGNGSDAENKSPAFPIFSPHPPVRDRALLPASERQVVVDVRLNAGGEVVSENLVKGIGNALDQMVLDTVKTWRFQPATVNGQPVASEAEVIVPFNQSYPIANS